MSSIQVSAKSCGPDSLQCNYCSEPASRVQMDYYHNHNYEVDSIYCEDCASERGCETCSCCETDEGRLCENDDGVASNLMPIYGPGVLDKDNMCSDHP